ncbi:CD151 antigen-like [Apostichopus japonicus]|uniref:CD151 antigen-like n=1 Tax=Stichopus japonicus TaxID=307972 RepID=UPI003AB208DB
MASPQISVTSQRQLLRESTSTDSDLQDQRDRSCSKYSSFFFNFMLLLVAFLTGGVSLWTWIEVNKLPGREGILLAMGPLFLACLVTPAVECAVAVVGVLFGLYGVQYRRRGILFLHFSLVLISSLTAVIFAIVTAFSLLMTENISSTIETSIDTAYGVYGADDVTADIDILQTELTCCGSVSYDSWADSEWLELERLAHFQGEAIPNLPPSCCLLHPNSTRNNLYPINLKACQGIDRPIPNEFMYQMVRIYRKSSNMMNDFLDNYVL